MLSRRRGQAGSRRPLREPLKKMLARLANEAVASESDVRAIRDVLGDDRRLQVLERYVEELAEASDARLILTQAGTDGRLRVGARTLARWLWKHREEILRAILLIVAGVL